MKTTALRSNDTFAVITIYKDENKDIQMSVSKSEGMTNAQLIEAVSAFLITLRIREQEND